jgi:hypothetical protein
MDPTITYLFNPKRKTSVSTVQVFDVQYKDRVIELTTSLFDPDTNTILRDSFRNYVHDCIQYLKQQDIEKELEKDKEKSMKDEIIPINGDQFIFAPKKIDVLVKKNKKNMFLIHGKT